MLSMRLVNGGVGSINQFTVLGASVKSVTFNIGTNAIAQNTCPSVTVSMVITLTSLGSAIWTSITLLAPVQLLADQVQWTYLGVAGAAGVIKQSEAAISSCTPQ
jgi:hypothetical protein